MDWKPIESAPKDGTKIDIWAVDQDGLGCRVADAQWRTDIEVERRANGVVTRTTQEGWADYSDMMSDYFPIEESGTNTHDNKLYFTKATHWLLVTPPQPAQ